MDAFETHVREYMLAPARTILDTTPLSEASASLDALGISAFGVVDRQGSLVGVLSRTDLIRAGRVRVLRGKRRKVLTLPDASVREHMTSSVEVIAPERSMREAAQRMLRKHVHRLFVADERRAAGVVSTKELMQAVVDARVQRPLSEIMHAAMVSVQASQPVGYAVDRMAASERSGVVVAEDGWPVGVFTQAEALAARDAAPEERVDEWMDPRIICLPLATPLVRAAEQAVATSARRVLVVDGAGVRGIVTAMDFARVVQG